MYRQLTISIFAVAGLMFVLSSFFTDDPVLAAIRNVGGVLTGLGSIIAGELVSLNQKK